MFSLLLPNLSYLIPVAILICISVLKFNNTRQRVPKGSILPPGPPGKVLVGNLPDIPPVHSWLKFKEWADEYGPIFRLNIAGRNHVVVSTEKVANDLLRSRGMIYSGREQLPSTTTLLSDNLRPLFLPHGETWRRGRKLMHQLTMSSAAASYEPVQTSESTRFMNNFIREPEKYEEWLQLYSSNVIYRLGFGESIKQADDERLHRIQSIVHTVERVASPGAYLVDAFPVLMRLPDILAPFKRELKALHRIEANLFRELLENVRSKMRSGKAPPCWERTFLENQEKFKLTDDEGAYVVGTLYEAGSSTTAASVASTLLALVHYPEWMQKIEEEVDEVVGDNRMPEFEDMSKLPIVRAVVKESLRWRPVTAGGVPHQLDQDDVYDGYFLPKGTNVHANQWAIHREEALYPDPETFNPTRWLSPSFPTYKEPLSTYPNLHNFSAFGFGRRLCPGMNIAERSLYILTARIAWACHVEKKRDGNDKVVEVPMYDYTTGFNVQPKWFPFSMTPRKGRDQIVRRDWDIDAKVNA